VPVSRVSRLMMAAVAPVVMLVASCSTPPTMAFRVEGRSMSQAQIDTETDGCVQASGQERVSLRPRVALWELRGAVADQIIADKNLTIRPADIATVVADAGLSQWLTNSECAQAVNAAARFDQVVSMLGSAEVIALAQQMDVVVSPIYGQWNPDKVAYSGTSGSLSSAHSS
jgi:hypothetical protein